MKQRDILAEYVEKALKKGWKPWWAEYLDGKNDIKVHLEFQETLDGIVMVITDKGDRNWDGYCRGGLLDWANGDRVTVLKAESIIYDPAFGMALWGEDPICKLCGHNDWDAGESFNGESTEYSPFCKECGAEPLDEMEFSEGTTLPAYLYHQQKMLLYEAPIMYFVRPVS